MSHSLISELSSDGSREHVIHTIEIPCKYYIKIYLENNCGYPVDLSVFPDIQNRLRNLLIKEPPQKETISKIAEPESTTVIIPNDWSTLYGSFMNHENERKFNQLVEAKLKNTMRRYIESNYSPGKTLASLIREFQEEYGFSESDWCYESIKKDLDRNTDKEKFRAIRFMKAKYKFDYFDNIL
jgi:hypothetical protein